MEPTAKKIAAKQTNGLAGQPTQTPAPIQIKKSDTTAIDLRVRPTLNFDRRSVQADGTWVAIDYARKVLNKNPSGARAEKIEQPPAREKMKK